MAIIPVGSLVSASGSGLSSLTVTPTAVGNAIILAVDVLSDYISSTQVTGGNCTWTRLYGPVIDDVPILYDLWLGVATSTGPATVQLGFSGNVGGIWVETVASQFRSSRGPAASWTLDTATLQLNADSTEVPFPALTPAGPGELYWGYAVVDNTGEPGDSAGWTFQLADTNNIVAFKTWVGAGDAPTAHQAVPGFSRVVAVLLGDGSPTTPTSTAPPAVVSRTTRPRPPRLPQFRLAIANTTTGQVVADLPWTGVPQWSRGINISGTLRATIPLWPRLEADTLQYLREPYRWTVLWCYGHQILQAGMLVKTTPSDDLSTAELGIMTLWDFLSRKRLVYSTPGLISAGGDITSPAADMAFGPTSPDPANQNLSWGSVARRLVEMATVGNTYPQFWLPIVLPDVTAGTATITYFATDFAYTGQRLTEITQMDGGPELEFSPEFTDASESAFTWRMRIGAPRLGQLGFPHAWDYGKAAQTYVPSRDGADMTFRTISKGQDSRNSSGGSLAWADSVSVTPPWGFAGWPWLQTIDTSHVSETDGSVLQSYAVQDTTTNQYPIETAAAVVRVDGRSASGLRTGSPSIDQVLPGDTAVFTLHGHPTENDGQYGQRVIGIGSGADLWTAALTLQVLGEVT
ncbi:hypothetical protein [Amycolatopsis taiwanensis]|uniref:hypothetical protein n=1 Tax=Amycolatopsis taiwanensis TaxID=342230 RepID=UPI000484C40B|nr:hypothetical protein [Amycolatopsis taiwanensis]